MKTMIRPAFLTLLVLSSLSLSFACAETGSETVPVDTAALVDGYNRFGIDLFVREAASGDGENIFVSPVSVSLCLGMAYNGAGGSTATEMAGILGAGSFPLAGYNTANGTLVAGLSDTGAGVTLNIANSLWLREGFRFRKDFVSRNEEYFGAGVFKLSTEKEINRWVSERTEGMIPSIIDSVDPADVAILVNAIYFKGEWTIEFDEDLTMDKPFHSPKGKKEVPMMKRTGDLTCLENELFQAVRLPYGKAEGTGGAASMYVFLPAGENTLVSLIEKLSPESWADWTSSLSKREGTIELPRFRAEYFSKLNGTLAGMGMKEAFKRSADFSRLCECSPGDVYISDVFHKAVVEVNEKGTEAAAATAITIRLTSAMPAEDPFHMVVDRPFLIAIVDDDTGLILFMGGISDPE
jgi:serine protease inhibitor